MFEKKPRIVSLKTIENLYKLKNEDDQLSPKINFSKKSVSGTHIDKVKKIIPSNIKPINKRVEDSGNDILWI